MRRVISLSSNLQIFFSAGCGLWCSVWFLVLVISQAQPALARERIQSSAKLKSSLGIEFDFSAYLAAFSLSTMDRSTGGQSEFISASDTGIDLMLKVELWQGKLNNTGKLNLMLDYDAGQIQVDTHDNTQFQNLSLSRNHYLVGVEWLPVPRLALRLGASYAQYVTLSSTLSGALTFTAPFLIGAEVQGEFKFIRTRHTYFSLAGIARYLLPDTASGFTSPSNFIYNYSVNAGTGIGFLSIAGSLYFTQETLESSILTQSWSEGGIRLGIGLNFDL